MQKQVNGKSVTDLLLLLKRCFTSTETVGLLGTGAQDVHLDFRTAERSQQESGATRAASQSGQGPRRPRRTQELFSGKHGPIWSGSGQRVQGFGVPFELGPGDKSLGPNPLGSGRQPKQRVYAVRHLSPRLGVAPSGALGG